jgi:hypothetical protein
MKKLFKKNYQRKELNKLIIENNSESEVIRFISTPITPIFKEKQTDELLFKFDEDLEKERTSFEKEGIKNNYFELEDSSFDNFLKMNPKNTYVNNPNEKLQEEDIFVISKVDILDTNIKTNKICF